MTNFWHIFIKLQINFDIILSRTIYAIIVYHFVYFFIDLTPHRKNVRQHSNVKRNRTYRFKFTSNLFLGRKLTILVRLGLEQNSTFLFEPSSIEAVSPFGHFMTKNCYIHKSFKCVMIPCLAFNACMCQSRQKIHINCCTVGIHSSVLLFQFMNE